jgi:hypothetical protein
MATDTKANSEIGRKNAEIVQPTLKDFVDAKDALKLLDTYMNDTIKRFFTILKPYNLSKEDAVAIAEIVDSQVISAQRYTSSYYLKMVAKALEDSRHGYLKGEDLELWARLNLRIGVPYTKGAISDTEREFLINYKQKGLGVNQIERISERDKGTLIKIFKSAGV